MVATDLTSVVFLCTNSGTNGTQRQVYGRNAGFICRNVLLREGA